MVMFAGHVIEGAARSSTKIVWLHGSDVLLQSSVATQVRVELYSFSHEPEVVDVPVTEIVGVRSQLSEAVGVPKGSEEGVAGHDTVMFAGHVMVGKVLSSTVIV
jgi:hypothetical protein